jgi:transcriptional regulator with XRE-family HTH domain
MLSSINTNIARKLKKAEYRHKFFRGRAQDELAYQLRRFRKKRGLKQSELAPLCGMKQSAISRIEQASYSRWSFNTLLRIAKALDVRVRIVIDDTTDVIREYEQIEPDQRRVAARRQNQEAEASDAAPQILENLPNSARAVSESTSSSVAEITVN